jgi:formylglycine-generating enzyme required for sulfatase activity
MNGKLLQVARLRQSAISANSAESRLGDTRPVGLYHPAGDSSSGAMDMAGNVAEWTMTKSAAPGDSFVVKGGSFMDDAQALRVSASMDVPLYTHANWLGFRCVREEP